MCDLTNGLLQGLEGDLLGQLRLKRSNTQKTGDDVTEQSWIKKWLQVQFVVFTLTLSGRLLDMMSTWREMVSTKLFLLVRRSSSAGRIHKNHPVS